MTKSYFPLITIAVFSLFSLIGFACGEDILYVQGKVYCDTCRIAFEGSMTEYIEGAKVKLECRDRDGGGHLTFSVEGVTDKSGTYRMPVDGDHEEEICEVILVKSPRPDCSETLPNRDRGRILMTANNGIKDTTRYANSLGFLKKEPLPGCANALKEMDLLPSAMIP